jgi:EAL domain-containing protein (putative c-di-GMP-specific phosphodiesterase class I)
MFKDVSVLFQPIVDLDTVDLDTPGEESRGTIVGAETLARFGEGVSTEARVQEIVQDPTHAAELTAHVCREALHVLRALPAPCYVTINLPAAILGRGLVEDRLGLKKEKPALMERLVVEITEDLASWDEDELPEDGRGAQHDAVEAAKNLGMRVALDDFGRRGGSIARLLQLEFDILKIDRAFVRRITRSSHALKVIRAIVAMARFLKVTTVAEGIEYADQATFARVVGVDYGQGNRLYEPM